MSSERRLCLPTGDKLVERPLDAEIARLASRQHGVIATRQLAALGLARGGVARRAQAGRLHRVHRGVYAVGHPVLTVNGRRMAAVLAAGPSAALSHASAAALWEIRPTSATRIDVSVQSAAGRGDPAWVEDPPRHSAAGRRDHRAAGHQGHHRRPHSPRPGGHPDTSRTRTRPRRSGGPAALRPHLPRCHGKSPCGRARSESADPSPRRGRRPHPHRLRGIRSSA